MKKVIFFTNIFPHYRFSIYKKLINSDKFDFEIFFSPNNPLGIPSIDINNLFNKKERSKLKFLKNYWFKKKIIIWQSKIIKNVLFDRFDYLLLLGDMYVISTWIACLIARFRGKKIYMWSHGLYGNENIIKHIVRLCFLKLAHVIFLYENRAKNLLIQNGFSDNSLKVVYNSLDFDKHQELYSKLKASRKYKWEGIFKNQTIPVIVFIGRITEIKKIQLLIDSIKRLNHLNASYNLLIIGGGQKLEFYKKSNQKLIDDGWLHFYGSSYNSEETSRLIYFSDLCVSPGNIGLTAIHSLSFGTPVVSHSNFNNQMPEVESIIDGENGFLFKEGDSIDLSNKINKWFSKNKKIDRDIVRNIVVEKYNPTNQLSIFTKSFLNG